MRARFVPMCGGFARFPWLFAACLVPGAVALVQQPRNPAAKPAPTFEKDVLPVLRKYCFACHGTSPGAGGVSLESLTAPASATKSADVWRRVARQVRAASMPPATMPQPTAAQRAAILAWLESALPKTSNPGRPTLRRLNRAEYDNTIRDLVGIDFKPAADFPSDDVGYGFDNIGDVLSISPLLVEKYLSAARQIAEKAIVAPLNRTRRFEAESLANTAGGNLNPDGIWGLFANGAVYAEPEVEIAGSYRLRVRAFAQQAGPEVAKMALRLDGKDLAVVDVHALRERPEVYEVPIQLTPGKHRLAVAFVNDYYQPNDPNPRNRDRNLYIDFIELAGPFGAEGTLPESHRRILFEQPTEATRSQIARKIVREFARRAFRRPVSETEAERYAKLVDLALRNGDSFEEGVRLAVQGILVSPHFLFRVELDGPGGPAVRTLSGFELASRLSYMLWSSMPDERLFALAASGELAKPAALRAEAERMLRDSKARALTDNFAEQWLQLRKLETVSLDPKLYPQAAELKFDMVLESKTFFAVVVQEDRSVLEFLDGRTTFASERLAAHYGLQGAWRAAGGLQPASAGSSPSIAARMAAQGIRRIPLPPTRGGVLTQGSVLMVTSNPDRTSPVKRGKWVLENLLGTPPPPPPPGADNLPKDPESVSGKTVRQRFEAHRRNPECASCHAPMDAIGFSLENFDPSGAWRADEGGLPIDTKGTLPGGVKVDGPAQLRQVLLSRKGQFVRCLAEKLLTYALGRGLTPSDDPALDAIVKETASKGNRFSALVGAIVQSEAFRKRSTAG